MKKFIPLMFIVLLTACSNDTEEHLKTLDLIIQSERTVPTVEELRPYFKREVINKLRSAHLPYIADTGEIVTNTNSNTVEYNITDTREYDTQLVYVVEINNSLYMYTIQYDGDKVSSYERAPYIRGDLLDE